MGTLRIFWLFVQYVKQQLYTFSFFSFDYSVFFNSLYPIEFNQIIILFENFMLIFPQYKLIVDNLKVLKCP